MNVYISYPIRRDGEYDATKQTLDAVTAAITAYDFTPFIPEPSPDATPVEVYQRDMEWINECELFIAIVDQPSHGVGIEIAEALSLDVPVLCVRYAGTPLSFMLLGNEEIAHVEYGDLSDLEHQIKNWFDDLADDWQE